MYTPADEFTRQRALDTYRVVDTLPEAAYDDIVHLASMLCGAPIALISLIDRDRQWFKARTGLDLEQTNRDIAFCDHVIRQPDRLMEINDAARDARFAENPFVTEDDIRFYAGMPLVTPGGAAIGTVCVLDKKPRELSDAQRQGLASLARLTMNLLEAGHRERELERSIALAAMAQAEAAPEEFEPLQVGDGFSIALFEVQEMAATSKRIGDRALGRALLQLEEALEGALRRGAHDSVSHAAGSGELIVVLHGDDCSEPYAALRAAADAVEAEFGIRVLSAAAEATSPKQKLEEVFLLADEELSRAKDARRAA
jgi:GAF domain-containing protein